MAPRVPAGWPLRKAVQQLNVHRSHPLAGPEHDSNMCSAAGCVRPAEHAVASACRCSWPRSAAPTKPAPRRRKEERERLCELVGLGAGSCQRSAWQGASTPAILQCQLNFICAVALSGHCKVNQTQPPFFSFLFLFSFNQINPSIHHCQSAVPLIAAICP